MAQDNGQVGDADDISAAVAITVGADWSATPAVPPAFYWNDTLPALSYSGPFTFTSPGTVRVDVTDDFVTGDGSFSTKHDPNNQEQLSMHLIYAQIVGALNCQKIIGRFSSDSVAVASSQPGFHRP